MSNLKIFFASLLLSLLYWGALNVLAEKTEKLAFADDAFFIPETFSATVHPALPEIEARAVISLKIDKNGKETVLYSKNEDKVLPIASITKLMTALVVFEFEETYNPFQVVSISEEAASQKGVSVLSEGERLAVRDILYISLLESSNDAAFSLSEEMGKENFVRVMNIYAKKIGLERTSFVNPTGLNEGAQNLSTAREIAALVKTIKENYPEILEITKNKEYEILTSDGGIHHVSKNTNVILEEFPEIIGGKTGWTPEAGGCLAVVVRRPDGYVINVILGADARFREMKKLIQWRKLH